MAKKYKDELSKKKDSGATIIEKEIVYVNKEVATVIPVDTSDDDLN